MGLRGFLHQRSTGFLPFSLVEFGGFFTWLQIAFDDYSFVGAHAKEEGNSNAMVRRPKII